LAQSSYVIPFATQHTIGLVRGIYSDKKLLLTPALASCCNQNHNNCNFCNTNRITREAQNMGVKRHNKIFLIRKHIWWLKATPKFSWDISLGGWALSWGFSPPQLPDKSNTKFTAFRS